MKHKLIISSIVLLLITLGGLQAQEALPATGGEATGTGGSVSYSVGQVSYTTNTGTNGSASQGVQQAYKISTTTGVNETSIQLALSVHPNPTTSFLSLSVEDVSELNYQLIDFQGKLIEQQKIETTSTLINMEGLPQAVYFLKVTKDNQLLKTFKIMKN